MLKIVDSFFIWLWKKFEYLCDLNEKLNRWDKCWFLLFPLHCTIFICLSILVFFPLIWINLRGLWPRIDIEDYNRQWRILDISSYYYVDVWYVEYTTIPKKCKKVDWMKEGF